MPPKAASSVPADVQAARDKLKAKMGGGGAAVGGSGVARRTKKKVHQSGGADEKQMQAQLKRLGVNNIPGIEEVNMFKEDGTVLHFSAPKVQASVMANTYVVTGHGDNKRLEELLPGIISQLGPDSLSNLKRIAEGFAAQKGGADKTHDEAGDIPDILENFEEVSNN